MITFEKAKEIALDNVDGEIFQINCARETANEYMFDNKDGVYDSHIPFIVSKTDGSVHSFDNYTRQYNIAWDDWKPIDFETGLPCEDWDETDESEDE